MKKVMSNVRGGSGSGRNTDRTRRVGKYEIGKTLGKGHSSIVKLATHVDTRHNVAIKILDKKKIRNRKSSVLEYIQIRNSITREISIMKMVRHPNIVRIIEVMATKRNIYIVLELVSGGELFHKIDQESPAGMTEGQARTYFQQLISAVDYCHSRGVTHRDLKPENLLVDENGVLKVSDFGLSALPEQNRHDGLLHSACGTPHYVAPELVRNKGYEGAKADIWSCGVILFFMNAGNLPFRSDNDGSSSDENVVYQKILRAEFTCPSFFSARLKRLMRRILDPNPATRITMNEIFEDEWFKTNYQPPRFSQENISFDDSQNFIAEGEEAGPSAPLPVTMNAIDIMHTFLGIFMGNIFYQVHVKREARFVSKSSATDIVKNIERVAGTLGFDVKKRNYQMSITIRGELAGRKGQLSIATEVYEMIPVDPPYHMVEFRKVGGNTLEFHKFYKDLCAELQDIIWIVESVDIETETTGVSPSTVGASTSTAT